MAGIKVDKESKHSWETMVQNVQKHVKSLNWGYKVEMMKLEVKYYNAFASFVDRHTIKLKMGNGDE